MSYKFIISENEKKSIRKLYSLDESEEMIKTIFQQAMNPKKSSSDSSSSSSSSDSSSSSSDSSSITVSEPGEYFKHPDADTIKLNYGSFAIPLNSHAEKLLKSIFAEAGTTDLKITSTLRTYEDQARVNSQNSRANILLWYGSDVASAWDKLKNGEMTQQEFADFLKERDKKNGRLMSNHLSGLAIDVTPYSEKFASTAEKLKAKGNSGIKKVLREKSNNAVHIEFEFPVTDKGGLGNMPSGSPTKRSEKISDKSISKSGIIIDKNNSTSNYSIVFGGFPSSNFGAKFMYEKASNILGNKNVVYSNFENSLDSVINYVKSEDPNAKIGFVAGFSAGGTNAWNAAKSGYKTGLIDPVVPDIAKTIIGNDFSGTLPSNIKMISRQSNWGGQYRKHGERLAKIEATQPNIVRNIAHSEMPEKFYSEFVSEFV